MATLDEIRAMTPAERREFVLSIRRRCRNRQTFAEGQIAARIARGDTDSVSLQRWERLRDEYGEYADLIQAIIEWFQDT